MKKLTLLIALACIIQVTATSQSRLPGAEPTQGGQACLPDGIEFTTQVQINNFQSNHPNCTEIEGNVTIGKQWNSSDITNLAGLNVITKIDGYLDIRLNDNLTNLTGLDSLTTVGGLLEVFNSNILTDLTGLNQLTDVGGILYIAYNDALTNLDGLESLIYVGGDLVLRENKEMSNITSLNKLTTIDGGLEIRVNDALPNLSGLSSLTSLGGHLWIVGNDTLTDITDLAGISSVGNYMNISYNKNLLNLVGFNNITSIGDYLEIFNNDKLSSLSGLDNLTSINGKMAIMNNPSLTDLTAFENLTSIGGEFRISNNIILSSLIGLQNIAAASIADLYIHDNIALVTCEVKSVCDYLAAPNGAIYITNNSNGCNNQEEVVEACADFIGEIGLLNNISIHPNPFSNSTTIEYELMQASNVQITIYNHLSKQVEMIEQKQSAGKQQVVWNAEGLPAGIYHCVFKTEYGTQTLKMIKLK